MSLKLGIDHGNLKFNLTSLCANSVKEATIQIDCFFHKLFGANTTTASHNVESWILQQTNQCDSLLCENVCINC